MHGQASTTTITLIRILLLATTHTTETFSLPTVLVAMACSILLESGGPLWSWSLMGSTKLLTWHDLSLTDFWLMNWWMKKALCDGCQPICCYYKCHIWFWLFKLVQRLAMFIIMLDKKVRNLLNCCMKNSCEKFAICDCMWEPRYVLCVYVHTYLCTYLDG